METKLLCISGALIAGLLSLGNNNVSAFSLSSSRQSLQHAANIGSSTFVQNRWKHQHGSSRTGPRASGSSSAMSMAIDRLSTECVAALKEAQDIGNNIGIKKLEPEIMFAGIVAKPENAAMVLEEYSFTKEGAKRGAIRALETNAGVTLRSGGNPANEALPFSDSSKSVLTKATEIADFMSSENVCSEHVLLALFGYNYGKEIVSSSVIRVLSKLENLAGGRTEKKFSVYTFCEDLVALLNGGTQTRVEQVVIGGKSGNTNTLNEVGVDMTQLALDGKLDAVFGRDAEIRAALRTLGRRRKNNPCLVGDPGVGKTAIAEAIAQVLAVPLAEAEQNSEIKVKVDVPKIRLRNPFRRNKEVEMETATELVEEVDYNLPPCPKSLAGFRLINIELASLVAGTANRGDFEKKIKSLIAEASSSNVILFIDEIHNLIGTGGGGDGAMNAANLLKPALARGELRILGATTTPEYRRYIEKDGALERRFQQLEVREPTVEETLDILAAVMPKYEEYHAVEYTSNALLAAAKLSDRYVSDRFLPDKAIDLLDEAGSMIKMAESGETYFVTEDSINEVISQMTRIPIGKLDTGEKARLRNLEEEIGLRIKGQATAIRSVARSIRRARSGMRDGRRPVASFLFCGPTGVGKTEVCKALAETYYGQEKDMIRIDMSEYMDRFSTSRLVGAPPGYVGYDEGGQLTEAVRRKPHSVILFDELEKAHEDVLNVLLQIMDEGTLTDGKGRTVNFKNTVLVMTSNIGSQRILEVSKSAESNEESIPAMNDVVKEELEKALRPELLNRIDEIVVFSPLTYENLKDIATNLIADTVKRVKDDQNIALTVSDNIAEIITREAMPVAGLYGARPIRRAVQRFLEDTMAEAIMSEFVSEGDEVNVNLKDPNGDSSVVKITRTDLAGSKEMLISVDQEAGITPSEDLDYLAAYGDLPSLDDPPKQEPDGFQ